MRTLDPESKSATSFQENDQNTEKPAIAKQQVEVIRTISQHNPNDPYMDLAKKSLTIIPQELFVLSQLQYLYLEENNVQVLQENFFDLLPSLQWLDLRNNKLTSIPTSIGRHQCIKHLLLEGNKLTHLPAQMGMTKSLSGLNLRGNPLMSPPQHIVDQGVYVILSYLYQELQNRTRPSNEEDAPTVDKLNLEDDAASTSDEELLTDAVNVTERNIPSPMSDDLELVRHGPNPIRASLHKAPTFQNLSRKHASNSLLTGLRNRSNREFSLMDLRQQQEDGRREQLRAMKERQAAQADQRRKNEAALEGWREETRRRQRLLLRSKTDINMKPPPFATDDQQVLFHADVREEEVERVLPSEGPGSREAKASQSVLGQQLLEKRCDGRGAAKKEKSQFADCSVNNQNKPDGGEAANCKSPNVEMQNTKDLEIRMRMKQHTSDLHRLRKQRDDERAATANYQESRDLQRQLLEEKLSKDVELEYRFRAFTGDSVSINSDSKTDST